MNEICSVCGVSRNVASKFYLNTRYGTNLCNKHYLQMKIYNIVTDSTQPNINDKRNYWTKKEEDILVELVNIKTPYKEISRVLNRSISSINDKVHQLGIKSNYKNNINFKAIYQDYDWCYQKYIVEGLDHDQMAEEANCTKRVIQKWCCERHRLTQEYRQKNKKLNDKQRDLIIGSMLGDGHIDKRENQPIFIVSHAENQKDYLFFKYEILKDFCNTPPAKKESYYKDFNGKVCYCQSSYRLCTRIQDCLLDYRGKSNTYLLNLLNEFSLAIWILDDGSRNRSNWDLCVAEYTDGDIKTAKDILYKKFNLTFKRKKDERYVLFDAISSRKIDEIILQNIPNSLDIVKDKIINNDICSPQKVLYVNYDNYDFKLKDFCKLYNLNYKSTWGKINKGLSIEEILDVEVNI